MAHKVTPRTFSILLRHCSLWGGASACAARAAHVVWHGVLVRSTRTQLNLSLLSRRPHSSGSSLPLAPLAAATRPFVLCALQTMAVLAGQPIDVATLEAALQAVQQDVQIAANAPGGWAAARVCGTMSRWAAGSACCGQCARWVMSVALGCQAGL